jgi:hypothetical protein
MRPFQAISITRRMVDTNPSVTELQAGCFLPGFSDQEHTRGAAKCAKRETRKGLFF